MLQAMGQAEGFAVQETLTGFKWLGNWSLRRSMEGWYTPFAFEEALGFAVGSLVRDKDGVSTAASALGSPPRVGCCPPRRAQAVRLRNAACPACTAEVESFDAGGRRCRARVQCLPRWRATCTAVARPWRSTWRCCGAVTDSLSTALATCSLPTPPTSRHCTTTFDRRTAKRRTWTLSGVRDAQAARLPL